MQPNNNPKKQNPISKSQRRSRGSGASAASLQRPAIRRGDIRRSYIVPVLSKAIAIINLIEVSEEPLSVRQIHEECGYSKATIYRILHTLIAHGVLRGKEEKYYSFRRIAEAQRVIKFTQGSMAQYKK